MAQGKEDNYTCNFEYPNKQNPNDMPVGYPKIDNKDPKSYEKLNPPNRIYVYAEPPFSHSNNPPNAKLAPTAAVALECMTDYPHKR